MTTPSPRGCAAFTLVELLVSMVLITLLSLILLSLTNQTSSIWRRTTGTVEQFRGARGGFESLSRQLSQATLNTYWDYFDASGSPRTAANASTFAPQRYGRQSELRFVSGPTQTLLNATTPPHPTHGVFFQTPTGFVTNTTDYEGLDSALNTVGYFIEFNNDASNRPPFITPAMAPYRWRPRLMEFMQPSEKLSVYGTPLDWFKTAVTTPATPSSAHVLAENIVALVILPKLSREEDATEAAIAPAYAYDSTTNGPNGTDPKYNTRNQLPPVVQVTMVAVDETTANRFFTQASDPGKDLNIDGVLFQDATKYADDLKTLEKTLVDKHLSYRVFTDNISIRAAKWSTQ